MLTAEMIAELPVPVRRSLERSGVVGLPIPQQVEVTQTGAIQSSPESKWLDFTARETYSLDPPSFTWDARFKIAGIRVGRATDSFADGRGGMRVRLLGLMTVVDETGPEIDQGSLVRWLNETMWFPAVWATDVISWEAIDDRCARGRVQVGDLAVDAEFHFDDEGRLVNFHALRYRADGDDLTLTPWSTPISSHGSFHGVELPVGGTAAWALDEGDFHYIRIEATDVRYLTSA